MKSRNLIVLGVATVVAGTAATAAIASGWKHHSTSRISGTVHAIVVDESAGDVHVTSERRGDVRIDRTTSWIFRKPTVTTRLHDGVLTLKTHCHGAGFACATVYRVHVPRGVRVTVRVDAGDVHVRGAASAVSAHSDAGDVSVSTSVRPSRIDARSDAGDIEVTVPRGVYRVDTSSDAGDEHLRGIVRDDRAPRHISARTDAGDVDVVGR
jgi:hypothetical protein